MVIRLCLWAINNAVCVKISSQAGTDLRSQSDLPNYQTNSYRVQTV